MARQTIASLTREIAALRALVASTSTPAQPSAKAKVRTFATKAERVSGHGFPCTAAQPCSRTDLRTAGRAASHGLEAGHLAR